MGSLWKGIRGTLDLRVLKAVWHFNHDFLACEKSMPRACEKFLERAGYACQVHRAWSAPPGGVLLVADHSHSLDGFAMSVACPHQQIVKRTIFLVTGLILGREVARHNIMVWPKGKWHGLLHEAQGFKQKLTYLCTHRWGPWVKPSRALNRMCQELGDGASLTLLPSGSIGDTRWRSGIGAILARVGETPQSFAQLPYLAPVYLYWDDSTRTVSIKAPGVIRMDRLYAQAQAEGVSLARSQLSQWLERQYVNRAFCYETAPAPAAI